MEPSRAFTLTLLNHKNAGCSPLKGANHKADSRSTEIDRQNRDPTHGPTSRVIGQASTHEALWVNHPQPRLKTI